jgi:hypothetical protein
MKLVSRTSETNERASSRMRKTIALPFLFLLTALVVAGSASAQSTPTLYVQASNGFDTALTAAIVKKDVPVVVVNDQDKAEFTLKATPVYSKDESGAGKIARCMFADCVGMNGFSSVSVELVRSKDSAIVWAYQVRKANSGPLGIQSLSEAIAKHLRKDYLDKHPDEQHSWRP